MTPVNIAFIPVRGGSKSIPLKNIKPINDRPLVYWTAKAACQCTLIHKVFVATDSADIRSTVEQFSGELGSKLTVVGRSADTATDLATTESAMLEFARQHEFINIALIQATSPLLTAEHLHAGFGLLATPGTDSVLSVVRQKRFLWEEENGRARALNYDVLRRPMRQQFSGYLMENGAFYITSKERLLASQCRISGTIRVCELPEETAIELDEPLDWTIVEHIMRKKEMDNGTGTIKMFLTDCDGCLTDGGMYYSESGEQFKRFSALDGMGISLLRGRGIITGIITGEASDFAVRRGEKLGMDEIHTGVKDKLSLVRSLAQKHRVELSEIAYVGDDINDSDVMRNVGLPCAPANAMPEVQQFAKYTSPKTGGNGAVRDIVEYILGAVRGS